MGERPASSGSGSLSGTVTDSAGNPVEAWMSLYSASGVLLEGSPTTAGSYHFQGLVSGTYFVGAWSSDFLSELYDGILCEPWCHATSGTPVPVADGEETTGIDFSLARYGVIQGQVTEAQSGAGIGNLEVTIHGVHGSQVGWAITDSEGLFSFPWALPGTYYARTRSDRLDQLYDGTVCAFHCDVTIGTPIEVEADGVANIAFALTPGGAISGLVRAGDYGGLLPSHVLLYDEEGGFLASKGGPNFQLTGP